MSAGDVLFVGWTGGTPNYKELAPQIQIEPSETPGFINKRVTINRVCFDKDKAAVIGNLPTGNAVLSSVYIDTDGSVKTQGLGGGYTLLSVSDASIAKGFSRVSAQYSKTVSGIFEVGLPSGLSIECDSGVCKIKYLTHVLEEIDSGTGECTSGLDIDYTELVSSVSRPFFAASFNSIFAGSSTYIFPGGEELEKIVFPATTPSFYPVRLLSNNSFLSFEVFSGSIYCNGIKIDDVKITNSELFDHVEGTFFGQVAAAGVRGDKTLSEIEEITSGVLESLIDNPPQYLIPVSCRYELFYLNTFDPSTRRVVVNDVEYYRVIPTYKYQYVNVTYTPKLEWKKTGNTITLQYGRAIIREYDVTGLT